MCGFLGIVSNKALKFDNFNNALKKISHRGPDNSSTWINEKSNIILGHNRLSIIDLSSQGNQPMSYLGRYKIIFNGEIYNYKELKKTLESIGYKFKSNTDTEIILASYDRWKEKCLEYFRGMFAFTIFDEKKNNIFIARDRVGEKPLYYINDRETLYFSSEIKSLLELKIDIPKINFETLDYFLTRGFSSNKNTIYQSIKKLPAAHYLNYNIAKDNLEIIRYWKLENDLVNYNQNQNKIEQFDEIIKRIISYQLNTDVSTGVLLSGGIDSSLITSISSLKKNNIKTFNVSFPNNLKYDESKHAKQISNYFQTDHHQIRINRIDPSIINTLIDIYDEPFFDSSAIPTLLIFQEIKKYCKVVLGGDGGDEVFGGYKHYNYIIYLEVLSKFIPELFRKILKNIILKKDNNHFKGKNWISYLDLNLKENLPIVPKYFDNDEKFQILNKQLDSQPNYLNNNLGSSDLVKSLMYENFSNYLCDNLLVKTDMASMNCSVELRSPFLDHKLIEFLFYNFKTSEKVNFFNRKIFLKKYSSNYFPKNYNYRRKMGFSIPFKEWLKEDNWKEFFYDNILSKKNIFNKKYAIDLMNKQNSGYDNSSKLYAILVLILWFDNKKFVI